jgi:sporulation protein YlmC with PRC-barrel domain
MFDKKTNTCAIGALVLGAIAMAVYPTQGMAAKTSPLDLHAVNSIEMHGKAPVGALIAKPAKDAVLARDFMGKPVRNLQNHTIGKVKSLVISDTGRVQAAIVDVGGFLGQGKKDIAIDFGAIQRVRVAKTGQLQLYVNADRAQLAAAPQFGAERRAASASRIMKISPIPGSGANMLPVNPSSHRSAVPDAEAVVKT